MIALLDRLVRILRSARSTGVLLLALLCMGVAVGASVDPGPAAIRVTADASATAPTTTPTPSSALDRVASTLAESIEASDAQDDPVPSIDSVPIHRARRKQFHALPAIAFTSALPSRSERPPIRSFRQS